MFKQLNTKRLTGVPLNLSLVDQRLSAIQQSAPLVGKWLYWCNPNYSAATNKEWVEFCIAQQQLKTEFNFAFIGKKNQEYIGEARISGINFPHGFANLSYWVNASHLKQGYASEIITAAAQFCFEELNLIRVEIVVDIDNHASIKTAKKVGGQFEGRLRHRSRTSGQPRDSYMFGLFPDTLHAEIEAV
ncbi:GNAT family N-acetyltransferase [Endozoicomonas sp. SM1973]|uniref:GNAT family N-acetyltransferase n=1 Tax=Spartinivicinus marinus TaxID=2994442 RepID=A0A853HY17_9GAMM|nr:GNAT family protein [Spartinivicinus marinus]MCX4027185.1 GNAT family protein [Spartinivicinus marinus]NYZ66093.1 GNAT family N-acetyltransferase [Spartinivicinus marinus]